MKFVVYGLILMLGIFHQDFWWWDRSDPLVLGFIPVSLAYHAGVSVAAAVLWAMAVKYCWPKEADVVDAMPDQSGEAGGGA